MMHFDRRRFLRLSAGAAACFSLPLSAQQAPMLTRPIPATGEGIPVIGLGTWQTFHVGPGEEERGPLREVLDTFASLGGRMVDSSPMYGEAEGVVGDLAEALDIRGRLFIATKVWTTGKAEGLRQMEESFQRLKVETLDLMQVHNLVDVERQLDTLAEWKQAGRVRYVGVTHYTAGAHDEVAKVVSQRPVDFIQINYSVGERHAENRLLPLARDQGIAVIANRPFAGGNLFRRLLDQPLPEWATELDCSSWAQLLLKFVISHPAMTCAIPATSKVKHLLDNMQAGYGRMPDEAMREKIAAAVLG